MRFGILGPLQVLGDDDRELPLSGPRPRAVLASLLLHANQAVLSDRLVEELWADEPPGKAMNALQVNVSRLRRALGERTAPRGEERLATVAGGYQLRVERGELDADEFEELVSHGEALLAAGIAEGAAVTFSRALGLWRGPPLCDFEYESFAQPEIARLSELYSMAVEQRIAAELACGRERQALGELKRLARENPRRERLQGQLMLCLYRVGRQADALEAYRRARSVLVQELGIEPSAELRELHQAILAQAPALDPPVVRPTNLPGELAELVGRNRELKQLDALVRSAAGRPVTVLGLGGTGKTTLAVALAARMLDSYEGGVWMIPLAGIHQPRALIAAIASALGVIDVGDRSLEELVIARLRARRTVLVLDNFEQLLDAAGDVVQLAQSAQGSRVLITSQLPLRVEAETVFRLEPLAIADGVKLFEQRAAEAWTGFDSVADRAAAKKIVTRLDGMPLAIELATARVAVMDLTEILTRLNESMSLLTRGRRGRPERQQSLRATLQWTFDLLSEDEQTLLTRLAAFTGPAPLTAVETVCGTPSGATPIAAADALMGLLDASLVHRSEDRRHGTRFMTAQVVRDFATELLAVSEEETSIRAAHASHLASLGEACRFWYYGHSDESRARVSALDDELHLAVAWTREHDPQLHLRLVSALGMRMVKGGRLGKCTAELSLALSRNRGGSVEAGWAGAVQGFNLAMLDTPEHARQAADTALEMLRAVGDVDVLGLALRRNSITHQALGDLEVGIQESAAALAISRDIDDPNRLCADLIFHAQALCVAHLPAQGAQFLDEAEALTGVTDSSAAWLLNNVRGDWADAVCDWALAARCYAASALSAQRFENAVQMIWDIQAVITELAELGAHEAILELEGIHRALADDFGGTASPTQEVRIRLARALSEAEANLGDAASGAIATGRAVPAAERGARIVQLVEQATAEVAGRW